MLGGPVWISAGSGALLSKLRAVLTLVNPPEGVYGKTCTTVTVTAIQGRRLVLVRLGGTVGSVSDAPRS